MSFRTKLASALAKLTRKTLRLLGREGTFYSGEAALLLDKNYINNVNKPHNIIAITGTNGKTTTNNMISDLLDILGKTYISNRLGSNTISGIASMLSQSPFSQDKVADFAIVEQDELWMRHYNKQLKPSSLTVTNLFQDSFDRNANVDYVFRRINEAISDDMMLILNASDSISAYLGNAKNKRVYFTIKPLKGEKECLDSKIQDMIYCPNCDNLLTWKFKRYHHIGEYLCENCGFTNPEAQYIVTDIDEQNNLLQILDHDVNYSLPLVSSSIENSYNQIAAYATLREYGFSAEELIAAFKNIKVVSSRLNTVQIGPKEVITMVSKGINPVATSRSFFNISKKPGRKIVIYLPDYGQDDLPNANQSWMYNTDMRYAQNIDLVIFYGKFGYPLETTALLDGVDRDKLAIVHELEQIKNYIDPRTEETIYILKDIDDYAQFLTDKTKKQIKEIVEA